jgi:O-antigen ligase
VATLPWSIAAMSIGLGLCAASTALAWVFSRGGWRRHLPILWPMLGWLVALAIAAWFAQDRAASLPRIRKGLLPALVWVGAWHGRRPRVGAAAIATLLVSAALAALAGLVLWPLRAVIGGDTRAHGVVGTYMTFGGQLLLWLPVACGVVLLGRGKRWRVGAAVAALLGFAALAATFTRSAWIGVAVALATMLAVARPRWLPGLAVALGLLVAVAPAAYRDRLWSSFDPSHHDNVERRHMWEAGGRMFRDHPITGVGLEDLHPIYERYKDPAAKEPAGHLHSVFVQIAASMGIVGLIAFAFLYGGLFHAASAGLRAQVARGGIGAGLRLGVTAALVGFLMAGFFEWNFGDEELLDQLYTLVGLAWAARLWPTEEGSRS